MKKIALFALALAATIAARAQIFQPATLYGKYENGLAVKRIAMFPTGCGNPATPAAADLAVRQAATYFDSCNVRFWLFNPKTATWDTLHIGPSAPVGAAPDWSTAGNDLTGLVNPKLGPTSLHDLVLTTNNVERARFRSTGNVWVSDTLGVNNIMAKPSTDPDYEKVIIPDIQNMVRYNWAYGRAIFDWLRDSATYYGVKAVLQVGDLTDWNTQAEWDTVAVWFNKIPSSIPVLVVPGNHDYGNGFNPATRDATRYKAWISSFNSGKPYYKGNWNGSDENYFITWEVNSKKYMAVGLEFLPRQGALDWASHIIDSVYTSQPDREVMVVTHAYINVYGELATDTSVYSGISYGLSADNSGQEMWDKLIKKKPSIKWVFNGHYLIPDSWPQIGLADRIIATGEGGNLVNQLFVNYQDDANWGDGYIMRLKFSPSKGTVAARYYSTYFKADDPRKAGFVLQNPSLSITTSVAVEGTQSVGQDLRVAGELKVETLVKKTVPYIAEDHALKSDQTHYFTEANKSVNMSRLQVNFPRTWASDHLFKDAPISVFDSAGLSLFQIRASKFDPTPYGEAYLANLYMGDSAGWQGPYGWNNVGIGAKVLYRARWGVHSVSGNFIGGKRAGYGLGLRNSSFSNVIIGEEAMSGDSTFCRFCTIIGQAGGNVFPGGEDMTGVGQAVFVNAKLNSFGSSAIGSNSLQNAYSYQAMAVGKGSFGNSDTVINSIGIGARSGRDGKHKGSILIGTFVKYFGDTENEFYMDNDGQDGVPELLWGRFINNPMLRIRGDLLVDDTLTGITLGNSDSSDRMATTAWVKRQGFGGGGGGSSSWTVSGANQYNALGGNVGLGTTTPSYKLQVNGGANNYVSQFYNNDNTTGVAIGVGGNNESDAMGLIENGGDGDIATYAPSTGIYRYGSGILTAKSGEVLINSTTDNGAASLQTNGAALIGNNVSGPATIAKGLQVESTTGAGGSDVVFQVTGSNSYNPGLTTTHNGLTTAYSFSAGSGKFSADGTGAQFNGGFVRQLGGSYFQGYQQAFTLQHYYSSIGGATLILDQDNGGGSTPTASTYKILDAKFHGVTKATITGDGKINGDSIMQQGVAVKPYRTWVANLSQSGTSAPTATVFENTLGGTLVWSYSAVGTYRATLSGAFPSGKVWVQFSNANNYDPGINALVHQISYPSANAIELTIYNNASNIPVDDWLINNAIEIRVYQ